MGNTNMQVIIPSAKLVPVELQKLGKLPAIIYPVNQRITFDYIYEQYCGSDFRVVAFENADKIQKRLEGYTRTEVIVLPEMKDLGFSIKFGLNGLKGEAIINFGDTIIFDENQSLTPDSFYYSEDEITDTWTFFEEDHGVIQKIIDKKRGIHGRGRLFCGFFYISKAEHFLMCIEDAEKGKASNTFYTALSLYSKNYALKPIKAEKWLDIGHQDRYFASQIEVKAREFNHIRIDKERGILTKYSDKKEKFIGEIKWYLKIPSDIEYIRPRIFDYSTAYEHPYISMEYYAYHTIHELYLYSDLTRTQWVDIFKRIRFVIRDLQRYTVRDEKIKNSLNEMYLSKTIKRLKEIKSDKEFNDYFNNTIIINGKRYKNLNEIICNIESAVPDVLFDIDYFNIIHGDLCFSNIMIDSDFNFIKVIDPRGAFGSHDIYGDPRYELAKLFHSIDGKYDYIIKDLFDVSFTNTTINYSIREREREYDLYKIFLDVFDDEIRNNRKAVELIEALLFLSMIPLHSESIKQQMVMLATGLDILNRVVKIEEENDGRKV